MRMTSHGEIILQRHLTSSFRQLLPPPKRRVTMNVHDTCTLWRKKLVDERWYINHRRILRRCFLTVHFNSHECVTVSLYWLLKAEREGYIDVRNALGDLGGPCVHDFMG